MFFDRDIYTQFKAGTMAGSVSKLEHHNKTHREHDNKVLTDYDKPWEHDDTPCENYDYTMWKFMINIDKMMIIIDKTHDF